jgi:hypothetical protein
VALTHSVRELPTHLLLTSEGSYSFEEMQRVYVEAFALAERAGRDALVVDLRTLTGPVPTMSDRYEHGVLVADLQARHKPRIRLAVLGHEPYVHPQRFGEIVAANRGAIARVFTDEAEALKWLLPKSKPG